MVFASSGSAIIPFFHALHNSNGSNTDPSFYITNISNHTVTVTVTFFKADGTVLTDGDNSNLTGLLRGTNVIDFEDGLSNNSVRFKIDPRNQSRIFIFEPGTGTLKGSGIIEWNKSNKGVFVALVAYGDIFWSDQVGSLGWAQSSITINGGLPF